MTTPTKNAASTNQAKGKKIASLYEHQETANEPDWSLVDQYLPLLKSIVGRMRIHFPQHVEIEDIYSIAVTGLVYATINYDASKERAFGTYAAIRIRGALLDELRRMDWMSRTDRSQHRNLKQSVDSLEQQHGRAPENHEIAQEMGLQTRDVARMQEAQKQPSFIPISAGGEHSEESSNSTPLDQILEDANQMDGRDSIEKKELVEQLRLRLDKLPEMSKKVMVMYYLNGLRLSEIAEATELTESRICQIHTQSLKELRSHINKHLSS